MKRQLCITTLFAVVLLPDWASACWPVWGGPVYPRTYYAPRSPGPVYYEVQPAYGQPVYGRPVYVMPGSVPAPMRTPGAAPGAGRGENARTDPPRLTVQPGPAPAPPVAAPPEPDPLRPAVGTQAPKSDPPKAVTPDPKTPPRVPVDIAPTIPSLDPPKMGTEPKLPPLELPGGSAAVPAPAPPPDLTIPAPGVPTLKSPDALPPLTLPPDAPVAPEKATTKVEARSSPLAAGARELKVTVFPAAGAADATGRRKIGFYNYTARDLALTIEGKAVTLPAMSYLHAQLPPTFVWRCADKAAATETVPADATGLDVLMKE
jgi:hypothetical protein